MILNDLLKGKKGVPTSASVGGSTPWRALVLLPTDYGFLCLVFVLWGRGPPFLVGYGIVFAASVAFLTLAALKWYRAMARLDRELAG